MRGDRGSHDRNGSARRPGVLAAVLDPDRLDRPVQDRAGADLVLDPITGPQHAENRRIPDAAGSLAPTTASSPCLRSTVSGEPAPCFHFDSCGPRGLARFDTRSRLTLFVVRGGQPLSTLACSKPSITRPRRRRMTRLALLGVAVGREIECRYPADWLSLH